MIDLHSHTTASDGTMRPEELVRFAAGNGVDVLAVTDHDTTAGLEEAERAANAAGITLVGGIELNISWPSGEFHLLGLGIAGETPELSRITAGIQQDRRGRNERIVRKMREDGMDVSMEELGAMFPGAVIGRPHIASFLVSRGICSTSQQAFEKYLRRGRPYYAERGGADLDEAIRAVKKSGGIPVLAHPLSLCVSYGRIVPLLENLRGRGIMGLEAFHSSARKTDALRLEEIAHKIGMFVTGGSDFHGDNSRKDSRIGHACNGEPIPGRLWTEELMPRLGGLGGRDGRHRA